MRSVFACGSALLVAGVLSVVLATHDRAEAAKDEGKMIAHNVYFSLKDGSPEARKKLVDACKKYLTKHPGEESELLRSPQHEGTGGEGGE